MSKTLIAKLGFILHLKLLKQDCLITHTVYYIVITMFDSTFETFCILLHVYITYVILYAKSSIYNISYFIVLHVNITYLIVYVQFSIEQINYSLYCLCN